MERTAVQRGKLDEPFLDFVLQNQIETLLTIEGTLALAGVPISFYGRSSTLQKAARPVGLSCLYQPLRSLLKAIRSLKERQQIQRSGLRFAGEQDVLACQRIFADAMNGTHEPQRFG